VDVFNAFDSDDNDIDYFYTSRLRGGVDEILPTCDKSPGKKLALRSSQRSKYERVQKHAGSFDLILDCVTAEQDINLLVRDCKLTLLGSARQTAAVSALSLIFGRQQLVRFADWCHPANP
jgi:hypothetical protein